MKQVFFILSLFIFSQLTAQDDNEDFTAQIWDHDLSGLWTMDSMELDNGTKIEKQQPLGYIGDHYQRFFIHFDSVIQHSENKRVYFVYGKTRVKENICNFDGIFTINEARMYLETEMLPLREGYVKGEYELIEDHRQKGSGILKGSFTNYFYIDKNGRLKYDDLWFIADGFENNQFQGTWTGNTTGAVKKCNWGDYRIPDSGRLDMGAGQFGPAAEFNACGWENYNTAWGGISATDEKKQQAISKEKEKWWLR